MKVLGAGCRVLGVAALAVAVSAHVGSPVVFFGGKAGPYDVRVVVRPPQVVPGVARVTVRAPADVHSVSIRPVYWRAGSRGAPSADETRRLEGQSQTFEGSLWLMARGAYTVDVIVDGARGKANVLVPVASVATGRLAMNPVLGALLVVLGIGLCAGLVNIVYKGAGESLLERREQLDSARRQRARRVGAFAVPIIALALLGGARWWGAVDRDYQRTMYKPSPLALSLQGGVLRLQATDTLRQPPGRPSAFVPDHGKLMHLFLVRTDDARGFAHLHPTPDDSSAIPPFSARLPALPAGNYHVFGDVVHETGFERTLVGSLSLSAPPAIRATEGGRGTPGGTATGDPDDAWYVGDASPEKSVKLADGSTMSLEIVPGGGGGAIGAGSEQTIRITVTDPSGRPARLEPYLGMAAHGVVVRLDGAVFVHLHPMGTVSKAAQDAFLARDRGDTTQAGRLRPTAHALHTAQPSPEAAPSTIEFPYAFPKSGSYRLFVQVKRNGGRVGGEGEGGRILTGAFALTVADAATK